MPRLTDTDLRNAQRDCASNWEILTWLVQEGAEFPDASARVARVLRLPPDEVAQMERDYDEIR